MKKKLEEELVVLAKQIIHNQGATDVISLHLEAQKLYEKLTLLKYVQTHFGSLDSSVTGNEIAERFEQLANEVLRGNKEVPESNPNEHEGDIMIPVMDTIKDMVQEMPEEETLEDILAGIMPQPTFVKRTSATSQSTLTREQEAGVKVGLNDKLAFTQHLFNNSSEDYLRVISQINTMDSFEDVENFINSMVRPDYNNWEGKEAYVERFLGVIARKFS